MCSDQTMSTAGHHYNNNNYNCYYYNYNNSYNYYERFLLCNERAATR